MERVGNDLNESELTHSQTPRMADIITDSNIQVTALVVGVILCGSISMCGTIANIINMIIFYQQGLNTTINISFFSMAISDLGSLIFQQVCNVYSNALFVNLDLPIMYHEFQYFTAGIIREIFAKITCLLTVYVTAERCFCITFPLHVKQMITPQRTTKIVISVYMTMFLSFTPTYSTEYIDWNFYPDRNRTLLGLVFREHKEIVEGLVYLFHAVLGILSFIMVVFLTAVLIHKLDRKTSFLKTANVDLAKSEIMSTRDKATMSMVILIASMLIMCYLPSVVLASVTIFEPEFTIGGGYHNLFTLLWALALLLENINSSVNIFFYYKMSTKYRQTFRKIFFNDVQ